jgi:hypothetical protein
MSPLQFIFLQVPVCDLPEGCAWWERTVGIEYRFESVQVITWLFICSSMRITSNNTEGCLWPRHLQRDGSFVDSLKRARGVEPDGVRTARTLAL